MKRILVLSLLLISTYTVRTQHQNARSYTASQYVKTDTIKANTSGIIKFASPIKVLSTFDFLGSGVFRAPAVFQDTVRLGNVTDIYLTWAENRKNIYFYERGADLTSPNVIFKHANAGSFDSAIISFNNTGSGPKAINLSVPLTFSSVTTNNLGGLVRALGFSGDTLYAKGASGEIIRIALVAGTPGQALGLVSANTYAPISIAGGGGGGAFIRLRYADNSLVLYPDTSIAIDGHNLRLTSGPGGFEGQISTVQDIAEGDEPTWAAVNLSPNGALHIYNNSSESAQLYHETGLNNPTIGIPNIAGTLTMMTTNGGQTVTVGNWAATPVPLAYTVHLDRGMSIDTLNSLFSNKHLTRFWTFDSGAQVQSLTLQNPSFTGSTVISQNANNRMTITNSDVVRFATTSGIQWFDGTFTGTMDLYATMTGNRAYTLPNGSGTFPVSATSPIVLDAITGNLTFGSTFISSLNGLTASVQSFSVGSTGTTPNIVSSSNNHQFHFPLAGTGVTSGTVSNGAQTLAGNKTFSGILRTTAFEGGTVATSGPVVNVSTQAQIFIADPVGGFPVVFQLPDITGVVGRTYVFAMHQATVNGLTTSIIPNGTQKVDGQSSIVLTDQYDYIAITSGSGNAALGWKVTGGQIASAPYAIRAMVPVIAYIRAADDSTDITVPGVTTGSIAVFNYADNRVAPNGALNISYYTNRIAIKSTYHVGVDSVKITGFYSK